MKVALFELMDWEKEYFKKNLPPNYETIYFDQTVNDCDVEKFKDSQVLVIFVYSRITKEVLDSLPNLKFIATMSMGVDHIDLDECKKRNTIVSSVPSYGGNTVAEHTFALILAVSRKIVSSYERVKYRNFSPEGLTGFDLEGKTLGIIGIGKIGSNVVRIAKGFGMKVLGYKKTPDPKLEKELGFEMVDLDRLYQEADIISLHLPLCKETKHLLDKQAFGKMKKGVVVVNTARGGLIDTAALIDALDYGKVSAAALDVLEEEPLLREEKELLSRNFKKEDLIYVLENNYLLNHPKVIITPHNAFNSVEALEKITNVTRENIEAFSSGKPINIC